MNILTPPHNSAQEPTASLASLGSAAAQRQGRSADRGGPAKVMTGPEVAVYLRQYRAVYIEVPKVACSSLKIAFANLLGTSLTDADGDPHRTAFPVPPASDDSCGALYPGLYTFGFVRNPWDRLVSCYRDKILGEVGGFTHMDPTRGVAACLADFDVFTPQMSFESFVEAVASIPDGQADGHFRSQYTFLVNSAGAVGADFVGRFERMAEDFAAVRAAVGLPDMVLPRVQVNRRPVRFQDYYSERTKQIVAERFATDVGLFGYRFGP